MPDLFNAATIPLPPSRAGSTATPVNDGAVDGAVDRFQPIPWTRRADSTSFRDETNQKDPSVLIQASKLQDMVDALLSAAAALRANLPQPEPVIDIEKQSLAATENTIARDSPQIKQISINTAVDSQEPKDFLNTFIAPRWVIGAEDTGEFNKSCRDYPEAKWDDPFGADPWANCNTNSSPWWSDSNSYKFNQRRRTQADLVESLCGKRPDIEAISWELTVKPFLVVVGNGLMTEMENMWLERRRIFLEPGILVRYNVFSAIKYADSICQVLSEVARSTYLVDRGVGDETEGYLRIRERENWQNLTMGKCLERCYRRGAMPGDPTQITQQAFTILEAIGLANIVFRDVVKRAIKVVAAMPAEKLVRKKLSEILCEGRRNTTDWETKALDDGDDLEVASQPAEGLTFELHDITILSLRTIGNLCISWTSYLDEHLKLTFKEGRYTLFIYWFGSTLHRLPMFSIFNCMCASHYTVESIGWEINRTYGLLFGNAGMLNPSLQSSQTEKLYKKAYLQLPAPPWLRDSLSTSPPPPSFLNSYRPKWFLPNYFAPSLDTLASCIPNIDLLPPNTDISAHLGRLRQNPLPDRLAYSEFPVYQHRLRLLKGYMAHQKARSLRDLWRDKRDTLSWYTFWAVIVVGAIGLVLTLTSLALSSAQTVAAFRALGPAHS